MSSRFGYPNIQKGANNAEEIRSYLRQLSDQLAYAMDEQDDKLKALEEKEIPIPEDTTGPIKKEIKRMQSEYDSRITSLETRAGAIESRLSALESQYVSLEARVSALEQEE